MRLVGGANTTRRRSRARLLPIASSADHGPFPAGSVRTSRTLPVIPESGTAGSEAPAPAARGAGSIVAPENGLVVLWG